MTPTRWTRRRALTSLAGAAAFIGVGTPAAAQWRASRPLQLVVPFPPGGSMDAVARALAEPMAAELQQPVVIDNRAGAGTTIAAAFVARAAADGHTLLTTGPVTHIVSGLSYANLKYDPVRSFAAVGTATRAPLILVVRPDAKSKSLAELVAAARSKPGSVSYASSGTGASPHLIAELLAEGAGVKFLHVPYRGVAPALVALLGGEVDFSVADTTALAQIQAGKLKALAVTTALPYGTLPGVPSVAQAGVDGISVFDEPSIIGFLAPAGTPADAIAALNAALNNALALPAVQARLGSMGLETYGGTARTFDAGLDVSFARYGGLVRKLGLTN